jgi:hypothetical protein
VLAVLAYGTASEVAQRQQRAVRERCAAADATGRYADRRVQSVITYASPQLDAAGTPAAVRRNLNRLVATAAAGQVPALSGRRAVLAGSRAWTPGGRDVRRRCLAYLDLRLDLLRRGAADADVLRTAQPELARARERALG